MSGWVILGAVYVLIGTFPGKGWVGHADRRGLDALQTWVGFGLVVLTWPLVLVFVLQQRRG